MHMGYQPSTDMCRGSGGEDFHAIAGDENYIASQPFKSCCKTSDGLTGFNGGCKLGLIGSPPGNNRVDPPSVSADLVDASPARAVQVHAGDDDLKFEFRVTRNLSQDRPHQAKFGPSPRYKANSASLHNVARVFNPWLAVRRKCRSYSTDMSKSEALFDLRQESMIALRPIVRSTARTG